MDLQNKIAEYLENPNPTIDLEWVIDMIERYPTFYLPTALYLRRKPKGIDSDVIGKLKTSMVLNCPDRAALADFTDVAGNDWAGIYPKGQSQPTCSTEQAINTFIDAYGTSTDEEDDELLERLIFNPVAPDYFQDTDEPYDPADPLALPPELLPGYTDTAEAETPVKPAAPTTNEIPAPEIPVLPVVEEQHTVENQPVQHAITDQPAPTPKQSQTKPTPPPAPAEDSSLMESLAKYFIKQQRFERAYEIISKLNLNYPEKSVYFADQLRFLRKVIINRRVLKQNQSKN